MIAQSLAIYFYSTLPEPWFDRERISFISATMNSGTDLESYIRARKNSYGVPEEPSEGQKTTRYLHPLH